jgi:hypothetical protein
MPINTLEYAKLFQTALDKQMLVGAVTGWMEANAGQVKYTGGNEIKIPTISTQGMGDYDRDTGFVQGAVTLAYQTLTMTQDRGRTFQLDAMDVDETNFVANASAVMAEFQRTQVIPEVDAYRLSKIFALANAAGKVGAAYTPAAATILATLKADILAIQDVVGDGVQLVIMMSYGAADVLDGATGINKQLDVVEFASGEVKTKFKGLDGNPIMRVPSARMKTLLTMNDGTTAGQEAGGFSAAVGAVPINWIITPATSPIAVSKTDTIRIFDPVENQKAHAWKLDYRKYHDLWIPTQRLAGVRANIGA